MHDPVTVTLNELWRLGGDTDVEEEFFGVILGINDDAEGNIYLLDMQLAEIKVFSPDGEYLRTIGREGEGPGEFRFPVSMFFLPDGNIGVVQAFPGKIVSLTTDGDPADDFPLPEVDGGGFRMLMGGQKNGDNLVLACRLNTQGEGSFTQTCFLVGVDGEGNETARYHEEDRVLDFANVVIDENVHETYEQGRWTVGADGRVYAVLKNNEYQIHTWKPDGTLDYVIERDYTPLPRTDEQVGERRSLYENRLRQQGLQNPNIKISESHRNIEGLSVRDDGTLWVMTSRGMREKPDDAMAVFDVYDAEGRFVHQVTLPGEGDPENDGYFFSGNRLYVVTDLISAILSAFGGGGATTDDEEEEPEPMAVICYEMDGTQLALK
jgi:sugar lactone lactonase YvrE